jgi:hypothetical protein
VLDQRGQLLVAALGFAECSMPSYYPALHALRSWLDSCRASGTSRSAWRARATISSLTRYDEKDWSATFYTTGMEHSTTSATGTGWEHTPWHATQRAAGDVEESRSGWLNRAP